MPPTNADSEEKSLPQLRRMQANSLTAVSKMDGLFRPDSIWQSLGILGYSAEPEKLLSDLDEMIAEARLSERVPDDVRRQFEAVRKQFLHGFAEYDFFHIAAGRAYLIAETALRLRFLEYYGQQIPFVSRDGSTTQVLTIGNFEALWQFLRDKQRRNHWLLESKRSDVPHKHFNGSFSALLRWAFDEELLPGRRATWICRVFTGFRNIAGHPSYGCQPPAEPARQICDVAEFINCLWGEQLVAGRLFPRHAPVHRIPFALVRDPESGGISIGAVGRFADWADSSTSAAVWIVLASAADDLANFRPGFEATRLPSKPIWGPGNLQDAAAFLASNVLEDDTVPYVDRLFLVRTGRDLRAKVGPFDWPVDGLELPRSPEAAAALPPRKRSGKWYLIRADYPEDAFAHVIERRHGGRHHKIRRAPRCLCGVDELVAFATWETAMAHAAEAQRVVQ